MMRRLPRRGSTELADVRVGLFRPRSGVMDFSSPTVQPLDRMRTFFMPKRISWAKIFTVKEPIRNFPYNEFIGLC
jgi:hypothetical protein